MKQLALFTFVLAIALPSLAVIRLCDNTTTVANVYATAQAAHDAATNGDTIYMVGSGGNYGALISTKVLYWFGPGFFLAEDNLNPTNPSSASFNGITLNTGSSGSVFSSIACVNVAAINCDNIIFRRCQFTGTYGAQGINVNNVNNVDFEGCYVNFSTTSYDQNVFYLGNSHNVIVRNSIVLLPTYNAHFGSNTNAGPVELTNDVFNAILYTYNSAYTNCIMQAGGFTVNNNGYTNNMGNSTQFGTANGNLQNQNMTTVFLGTSTSPDGWYRLATNSPAIGAGAAGADMGAYGGPNPYVLGGIPPIPFLRLINAPVSGTSVNGLPVTIQVQGRN